MFNHPFSIDMHSQGLFTPNVSYSDTDDVEQEHRTR